MEKSIRSQGNSKNWRKTRLHHITLSNFGTICKATEKRDYDALTDTLTTHCDLRSAAILHGRKYESVAIEKFEAQRDVKTELSLDWSQITGMCDPFCLCIPAHNTLLALLSISNYRTAYWWAACGFSESEFVHEVEQRQRNDMQTSSGLHCVKRHLSTNLKLQNSICIFCSRCIFELTQATLSDFLCIMLQFWSLPGQLCNFQ